MKHYRWVDSPWVWVLRFRRIEGLAPAGAKPILFSEPMVRRIQAGCKTETRRIVKPQPDDTRAAGKPVEQVADYFTGCPERGLAYYWKARGVWNSSDPFFPPWKPGMFLWVREGLTCPERTWLYRADNAPVMVDPKDETAMVVWAHHKQDLYCPSMFMPRWASRITLGLTEVRCERLQSISREDAFAEGIHEFKLPNGNVYGFDPRGTPGALVRDDPRSAFAALWDSIHGKG